MVPPLAVQTTPRRAVPGGARSQSQAPHYTRTIAHAKAVPTEEGGQPKTIFWPENRYDIKRNDPVLFYLWSGQCHIGGGGSGRGANKGTFRIRTLPCTSGLFVVGLGLGAGRASLAFVAIGRCVFRGYGAR